MPLAVVMGVSWEDSFIVAELIGIKTFLNELMAYQKMAEIVKLRDAGGPEYVDNVKQYISVSLLLCNCKRCLPLSSVQLFLSGFNSPLFLLKVHSEMIATYALCGFSNFASLGISYGCMCECSPQRPRQISRLSAQKR